MQVSPDIIATREFHRCHVTGRALESRSYMADELNSTTNLAASDFQIKSNSKVATSRSTSNQASVSAVHIG
jgi:hypothetical protein